MKLKTAIFTATLSLIGVFCSNANNLVINGNFSNGNASFTSDYTEVTVQHPDGQPGGSAGMWAEATYTVLNNPKSAHNFWQDIPAGNPYNTTNQKMLIVNGSGTAAAVVWQTSAAIDTDPTKDYFFQAIVTNLYAPNLPATNGAKLTFAYSLSSNSTTWFTLGTVDLATTVSGVWQITPASPTYTINDPTEDIFLRITNSQTELNGNDFAIGLVSLDEVAIPEPTSALLLGSFAALMAFRRRRA